LSGLERRTALLKLSDQLSGIHFVITRCRLTWQSGEIPETIAMLPTSYRVARVQETLRRFEQDIPLLNMRVKDLSAERQRSARQFAEALVSQTRAELDRLLAEEPKALVSAGEIPCEPAD
jgi:hypothetical protein